MKKVPVQIEKWTYKNNVLNLYTLDTYDTEGTAMPNSKTNYKFVNGNKDEVSVRGSMYMIGL